MASAQSGPWMNSPWKKKEDAEDEPIVVMSLEEIQSEELARMLQREEEGGEEEEREEKKEEKEKKKEGEEETMDDAMLARLLQHQFDREHDDDVKRQQKRYNGNDKVSISMEKYMHTHPLEETSSSEDDEDLRELSTNSGYNLKNPDFGASGFVRRADGQMVTKHDKDVAGRKNTSRMLQFPPDFPTGDAFDMKLNNQVYNVLKKHSMNEQKRHQRVKDKEEKATTEHSMDARTRLILFKMLNNQLLESIRGAIATGKESVVFHAIGGQDVENGKEIPAECAIKVFKTVLSEFKNRVEYVKDDFRFKNPRKVLRVWAEKEFLNLNRMNRAGLRCPKVVKLKKHVLVMSFIGEQGKAAPKLKDVQFTEDAQIAAAFSDCCQFMTRLYRECKLVHADLSGYNILYWDGGCWFIDVSQAVDTSHPQSLVFLARDCQNIVDLFRRFNLEQLLTARQLFNSITDLDIDSEEEFMAKVQEFALHNRPVQLKDDKTHTGDCSLRKYLEERNLQDSDSESPSAAYE